MELGRRIIHLAGVLLLLLATACTPQTKLQALAKALSSQCPVATDFGFNIESAQVTNGDLVLKGLMTENEWHQVKELRHPLQRRFIEDKMKQLLTGSQAGQDMAGVLKDAEADLVLLVEGSQSQEIVQFRIAAKDL